LVVPHSDQKSKNLKGQTIDCGQRFAASGVRARISFERELHRSMQAFASPEYSFEDLFRAANAPIKDRGFEDLDLMLR
jgi:hypothetical protein